MPGATEETGPWRLVGIETFGATGEGLDGILRTWKPLGKFKWREVRMLQIHD